MTRIESLLDINDNINQEVFNISALMKSYIVDLDDIEYGFVNVNAAELVGDDIYALRDHSLEALSWLFQLYSRTHMNGEECFEHALSILFSFLREQFEVRLRLMGVYWERMKAQQFITANPDFGKMGEKLNTLATLIQECGDMGVGKEKKSNTHSEAYEESLTVY